MKILITFLAFLAFSFPALADLPYQPRFTEGSFSCYMTTVAVGGNESAPSTSVSFAIDADNPAPLIIFIVE